MSLVYIAVLLVAIVGLTAAVVTLWNSSEVEAPEDESPESDDALPDARAQRLVDFGPPGGSI